MSTCLLAFLSTAFPLMFATFKYRDRDTIIQRLDPRTRLITLVCFLFAIIQFWDIRVVFVFFLIALWQYFLAGLTWQETKRFWTVALFLIVFFTIVNSLTLREAGGVVTTTHIIWQGQPFQLFNWTITPGYSIEQAVFAATMFVRLLGIALFSIIVPFTIHPAQYGITFRQLGLPDGFSYAMDLAFRFVPSLGEDFATTFDAQKARGYAIEKMDGGVVKRIQRLAPLVVPVTLRAILGGEEVVDAMDMRAFGSGKRTWYHHLTYSSLDKIIIVVSVIILIASFVAARFGFGQFWVPEFLIR
jgi:energy-coupling factor transport system permease protein